MDREMAGAFQSELIAVGQAEIEVALSGNAGPLAVMVPGLGRGMSDFNELAAALVLAGWRTASVNPRGAGKSRGPLEGLTMHDLAADLAGVIETLDGAPAAVIGHAFGNRVARCLAADRPELVSCVVLLAAGGKVLPGPEFREAVSLSRSKDASAERRKEALKAAYFAEKSDSAAWMTGNWPQAGRTQQGAGRTTPLEAWWSGGNAPILVVQGREDICAPPENGLLLKKEFGDRITLEDIPDAAHALLPEQPALIAETVIAYLKKHHPAGR